MLPDGLVRIARMASLLEPDAYVVFAGNNWFLNPSTLSFQELAGVVRESGEWKPLTAYFEQAFRKQIAQHMKALAEAVSPTKAPLVFVIPAFNLKDFRIAPTFHPESVLHNPLLSTGEQATRQKIIDRVELERSRGPQQQKDEIVELATSLINLERGVCPIGFHILAAAELDRGALTQAIDSYMESLNSAFSLLRAGNCRRTLWSEMRLCGAEHEMHLVDLPQLFLDLNGGLPPGRELFVDDVHLTGEGVRIAMALVAERLLPVLGFQARSRMDLFTVPVTIEPRALAQSHFVGAVVNIAYGQSEDVVSYHCDKALESQPEIVDVMRLLVDRAIRKAPDIFCRSHSGLRRFEKTFPGIHVFTEHPQDLKILNMPFIKILLEKIAAVSRSDGAHLSALLRREHGVNQRTANLLHASTETPVHYSRQISKRGYLLSHQQRSQFHLICDGEAGVLSFKIVCRVRYPAAAGQWISVLINGSPATSFPATVEWTLTEFLVESGLLHDGVNTVTVLWPDPQLSRTQRVQELCERFENPSEMKRVSELYAVYGEIHEFSATSRARASRSTNVSMAFADARPSCD